MYKKFDSKGFMKELSDVINKFSDESNQFNNAEIIASLSSILIATLRQGLVKSESVQFFMHRMIDEAFQEIEGLGEPNSTR